MWLWCVWWAWLAAGLVCALGWRRWARARDYWRRRGVPHLPPAPLLGSLTFMLSENIIIWINRVAKQFSDRPYFGMWLFWRPALVVTSAELARNILSRDSNNFRNRYASGGTTDTIGCNCLFLTKDPFWSSMRKRLSPFFTTAKLNAVAEVRLQRSKDIVERVRRNVQTGKREDLRNLISDYTTDVVVAAAFGLVENASLTGSSIVKRVTKEFMHYSIIRGIAWTFICYLPSAANLFRCKVFPEQATNFFRKVFNKVVEERGGWERETSAEARDVMDGLLQIRREAKKNGEVIPEDHLLAQAIILLQGGFDTTAITACYTIMELAYHPEYQEAVYKELKAAKDKMGDADFDNETISQMIYLTCAVKESLRKYPALSYLDREALNDYQVDETVTITKGTPVFINVYGLHYNPEYFEEPNKFKPERFFPENIHNVKPYTYMPFGEGPRKCIAYRFGLLSVYFVVAYILAEWEVRPRAGCPRPDLLRLNPRTILCMPDVEMLVDFLPRKR